LRKERFKRIVKEILNGNVPKKDDRDNILILIKKYVQKYDLTNPYFLKFDSSRVIRNDPVLFESFVFDYLNISNWEDFEKKPTSKKESAKIYGNTKKANLHTSDKVVIIRKRKENAQIYTKKMPDIKKAVVVENFESFVFLDFDLFEDEWFVYLGGESNRKVREYLKDKELLFFVDFDFAGIKIFENFICTKKDLFLPENIEEIIKNSKNQDLYLKQRLMAETLKLDNPNAKKLFDLIMKYAKCAEQELLDSGEN
jgi:hypothetical protein